MVNSWTPYVIASALAVSVVGLFIWKQKKKFVRVGRVKNLHFIPVKSLGVVKVNKGKLTNLGFEVNGLLERSFMLVDSQNVLVSQRQCPSMVTLTPELHDDFLLIHGPGMEPLRLDILKSPPAGAKVIDCKLHLDVVGGIDCGRDAALWFQKFLQRDDIRVIRFFPSLTTRTSTMKREFYVQMKKKHVIGFQDEAACHVLSQASIDELNSKIGEGKVSELNFRPSVLVDECGPTDEDSWKYIKIGSEALLETLILTTRCLLTTNDPETGILTQREPLTSLRKYRIPADPTLLKIVGAIPCLGTSCAVLKPGEIKVGDDVFAVVKEKPKMQIK